METYSFFNSINGDRKYQASDFAEYFKSLLTNGVFPNPSDNLQVLSNGNSTVTIKKGKAWINGYVYFNTSDLVLPIEIADSILNRIDRIVIRFDTINRNITAKIKKGTASSTPVAPSLQRDADIYELAIADIYVNKGVTSISQTNIVDLRMNTSVCGWVNSLIQADTTTIFNQYLDWLNTITSQYTANMANKETQYQNWFNTTTNQYTNDMTAKETQFQSDFNTWFNSIKAALDGDVAGNLLNKIEAIAKTFEGRIEPTGIRAGDFWFKEV